MPKFRLFSLEVVVIGLATAGAVGVLALNYFLGDVFTRTTGKVTAVWRSSTNFDGRTYLEFRVLNNSKSELWYNAEPIVQCLESDGWTNFLRNDNLMRDYVIAPVRPKNHCSNWVEFEPIESPWRVGFKFLNVEPKKAKTWFEPMTWFQPKRVDSVIIWSSPYRQKLGVEEAVSDSYR